MAELGKDFFRPDFSEWEFYLKGMLETLAIAIWGTLLAVLLGTLCAIDLVLALLAVPGGLLQAVGIEPFAPVPIRYWSLFANVLSYLAIAAFFAAEFAWRRHRFPQQPYRGFGDFMVRVARLGPAFWRGR